MLKLNRKLSKKGFTLIELMVAIIVLAIAAVGIFQAFSVGLQSMADAKDRTAATNLAQKKLEEVKNSVKVDFPYFSTETIEVNGKIFTIITATHSKADNLEQVFVTVNWHNRQGVEKNVRIDSLVYDLKTIIVNHPDVGRVHLSAEPAEITCCVDEETSTITAELFNTADPEQRVGSGIPVSFDVISGGNVDTEFTVTNSTGRATTQLTINGLGPAYIIANSGLVHSNDADCDGEPLEVTCLPVANEIILSASPSAITPGSYSTVTAEVKDTCGNILSGDLEQVDIEFITDKGSFSDISSLLQTTVTTVNGVASVVLYMEVSGEAATVDGTITVNEEDISDSTTVLCTDYSITVTANPTSINPGGDNDTSIITATLTQAGTPPAPAVGESISFVTDKGSLSAADGTTGSDGTATVSLTSLFGGDIATITVSYEISAGNTISDTVTVQCTEYIINITANPDKIIPGDTSAITATLTNYEGNPAANKRVDFYTNEGILSDSSVYTDSNGLALTTLNLDLVGITATVSGTYGFTTDTVSVDCIEYVLEISAEPSSVSPGESSVITATLTNYLGVPQSDQTITFTTNEGTFSETGTTTASMNTVNGEAVVHLELDTIGTTATVTAEFDVVENSVAVECSESTYITLQNSPTHWRYNYSDDSITFSINLHGGPLTIDKVKINWQTDYNGYPSRYRRIWIRIPGGNWTLIYNRDRANNGSIETLNQNSPYTLQADQTYEISVNFSYTIRHRYVTFTLNPDDPIAEDNYQVEFYTPY